MRNYRARLSALLHDVRQFVRKQVFSLCGVWGILMRGKDKVLTSCVGASIDRLCGFGCKRVSVHTHTAEVAAEAPFHQRSHGGIERLSWRAQSLVNDRGSIGRSSAVPIIIITSTALNHGSAGNFFLALAAFFALA
jgi:hypothetical protein